MFHLYKIDDSVMKRMLRTRITNAKNHIWYEAHKWGDSALWLCGQVQLNLTARVNPFDWALHETDEINAEDD